MPYEKPGCEIIIDMLSHVPMLQHMSLDSYSCSSHMEHSSHTLSDQQADLAIAGCRLSARHAHLCLSSSARTSASGLYMRSFTLQSCRVPPPSSSDTSSETLMKVQGSCGFHWKSTTWEACQLGMAMKLTRHDVSSTRI